jgi:hypothetical protein
MNARKLMSIVAVVAIAVGGCETVSTTNSGAVGVDRKQQMLVPSETIEQGAAEAYEAELKAAREKGVLNTDKAQLARVTTIARRIVAVTPVFRADAARWNWQFNVQKTKDLNAYCMPGGRIMVYSGLIDALDLTDAELATVLAHEVGHALREHTRERVSRAYAQQLVLSGAAAVTGVGEGAASIHINRRVPLANRGGLGAEHTRKLSGWLPPRSGSQLMRTIASQRAFTVSGSRSILGILSSSLSAIDDRLAVENPRRNTRTFHFLHQPPLGHRGLPDPDHRGIR